MKEKEEEVLWKRCENKDNGGCISPAHVRYFWPGRKEGYACLEHAAMIITVANVMGFVVSVQAYSGEKEAE